MTFQPGDIQFLAQPHTILHSRTGYEDWPEVERKRHLLRLWLAPPGARPLPPVFAECYGGTTIGDRGGIICKDTKLHAPLAAGVNGAARIVHGHALTRCCPKTWLVSSRAMTTGECRRRRSHRHARRRIGIHSGAGATRCLRLEIRRGPRRIARQHLP